MKLHNLIFIGMLLGFGGGIALFWAHDPKTAEAAPLWHQTTLWWLNLLGTTLFLGALKMIIAPLIFASLVAGVTTLPDMRELGAIGWKTLVYYVITTTIAVAIGLVAVLMIRPGESASSLEQRAARAAELAALRAQYLSLIHI